MTMTTSSDAVFPVDASDPEQRVWALGQAKRILSTAPFGKIEVLEVVDLSSYILTGVDPYSTRVAE